MSEECCGSQQSARASGRALPHRASVPNLIHDPASSSSEYELAEVVVIGNGIRAARRRTTSNRGEAGR